MRNYVFRRLMLLPITVILLSIFVFGLIRLVPGSVIDARLSAGFPGTANADDRAKLEAHFGLDKPVHVQYVNWIGQVFSGDFGTSWLTKEDILDNFGRRMPVTIELLILTLVIYIPLGIGTGVWSAVRQNRADDYGIRFVTILFLAIPNFWLATLVIVVPLVLWGYAPPVPYVQLWEDPGDQHRPDDRARGDCGVGRGRGAGTGRPFGNAGSAAPGLRAHGLLQGAGRPRRDSCATHCATP